MITLIKNFRYDNNYDYVKSFGSKADQENYFNSLGKIVIDTEGYVKEYTSFSVDRNYDDLVNEGVNYLIIDNGLRDVYCFITSKEYLSEDVTRLNYEVDVFQTYLFDFDIKKSFIERKVCNLGEILDYDEGLEMGEHSIVDEQIMLNKTGTFFAMFNGFKDYKVNGDNLTQYDYCNESKPTTYIDGIAYPLAFSPLDTTERIDFFYKYLADMPNLLGIIKLPSAYYESKSAWIPKITLVDDKLSRSQLGVSFATVINGTEKSSGSYGISKGDITDFYPYTYYVLTDGETSPLTFYAQYTGSSVSVKGQYALSHTPSERYYLDYYKGDTEGRIYNITNNSVMSLPTGYNGGLDTLLGSVNQWQQTQNSMYNNILTGAVSGAVGIATGGLGLAVGGMSAISNTVSGINTVRETMARNKDLETTPNTIKSYGTPSTRHKFNTNNVRILKYTIQDKYKNRINDFIQRYGNKFNNYGSVDLKQYKGYIKFVSVDLDTGIDNQFTSKLINILERGVYID